MNKSGKMPAIWYSRNDNDYQAKQRMFRKQKSIDCHLLDSDRIPKSRVSRNGYIMIPPEYAKSSGIVMSSNIIISQDVG